jgi:hypothetical protein
MRSCLLLLALVLLGAGEAPRTGAYKTTFAERHPESEYPRMRLRYGWGEPTKDALYNIAAEEFEVYVPPSYDGTVAYGLMVYTSAGQGGGSGKYRATMDKHRLIWIGATNVPNERDVVPRWGLSLDAVWNMGKRYRLDPRRIYATGMSGGGRCASMVAPTFADVFSGALYLVGCNPPVWPPEKQVGKPIRQLALGNRYALMTGSDDYNRPGTKSLFDNMRSQGFKHVEYFEEPGLGHALPSAEWFDKGVTFVDQPLRDEAAALLAQAKAAEGKKPYDACRVYRSLASDFPIAVEAVAEAQQRLAAMIPAVDEALRGELAKLASASAEKQRAFVARAAGFPCEAEARVLAETSGDKELAALQAAPGGATAAKLAKYLEAWTGYACAGKAGEVYDALAATALEPLAAQAAGKRGKPLAKYLKDWQACPSRTRAEELLEGDLAAEVAVILAIDKVPTRGTKLQQFAKAWPGTKAAAKAEAALKELVATQGK